LPFFTTQAACPSSSIEINYTNTLSGGTLTQSNINSWAEQKQFCIGIGKRLCTLKELCPDRPSNYTVNPFPSGFPDTFQPCAGVPAVIVGIDSWVAYDYTGGLGDSCASDTWVQLGTWYTITATIPRKIVPISRRSSKDNAIDWENERQHRLNLSHMWHGLNTMKSDSNAIADGNGRPAASARPALPRRAPQKRSVSVMPP